MGIYKTTHGQSIYDVALHIYGSVEGITDLLINNETLSIDTTLQSGDELIYTDDYILNKEVVAYYTTHNITPSTGLRSVYPKYPTLPKSIEIYTSNKSLSVSLSIWGVGRIEIDWGDNSDIQSVELKDEPLKLSHTFDNKIKSSRKITLYFNTPLKSLDFSGVMPTSFYILRSIYIERFTLSKATLSLESLPLVNGLFECHLNSVQTDDLTPLIELTELKELSLTGFVYTQPAIDAYLVGLVENYDNRRACTVEMVTEPSPIGMEAINTIINEPAWNEAAKWKFIINGTIYQSNI